MKLRNAVSLTTAVTLLMVGFQQLASAEEGAGSRISGEASGDAVELRGREGGNHGGNISPAVGGGGNGGGSSAPPRREIPCDPFGFEGEFQPDANFRCELVHTIGAVPVPYFIERTDPEGETTQAPITVSREEFQSLPIRAGALGVQPDRGWALVNKEMVVWSDADEHILTTTVLGVPVEVRAVPVSFSWDFGDGSSAVVTECPGAPWPEGTIRHAYGSAFGAVQISVRTEWRGEFRPVGAQQWQSVSGTASTTSTADPIEIVTVEPGLIAEGHNGN